MKLFEAIRKQLRAKARTQSSNFSLIREEIDDSGISETQVLEAYQYFGHDLLQKVYEGYMSFLQAESFDTSFHFIKQNGISGFAIDCYKYDLSISQWRKLQLHCHNCLKKKNYITHVRQLETKHELDNIKSSYKYYLKPSIKLMTSIPSEQLYGNLSIELLLQNDEAFRFLVHANYYSDRNYKKEQKFNDLLDFFSSPI